MCEHQACLALLWAYLAWSTHQWFVGLCLQGSSDQHSNNLGSHKCKHRYPLHYSILLRSSTDACMVTKRIAWPVAESQDRSSESGDVTHSCQRRCVWLCPAVPLPVRAAQCLLQVSMTGGDWLHRLASQPLALQGFSRGWDAWTMGNRMSWGSQCESASSTQLLGKGGLCWLVESFQRKKLLLDIDLLTSYGFFL